LGKGQGELRLVLVQVEDCRNRLQFAERRIEGRPRDAVSRRLLA
jgi:hypothetical protein